MPVSQNQRLRKAAAKAAKRKAVVTEKLAAERRELAISKPRHVDIAKAPIVGCFVSRDFQAKGMASVAVARKLSLGRYALSVFLLDLYCLGVKDSFFRVLDPDEWEIYQETLAFNGDEPIAPARARKLIHDSAAYGAANGFPPAPEFAGIERMLADVAPSEETFVFGMNGKPHYIRGPNDSESRAVEIYAKLEEKFGPDGFTYTNPQISFEPFDESEFADDADLIEGEAHEILDAADAQSRAA